MSADESPYVLPPLTRDFVIRNGLALEVEDPQTQVKRHWLDGRIEHFSATSLRLLKVCPEAYRQRYILGKKERPGEALTLGKACHTAWGHNLTQKVESHQDLKTTEVLEYFHDAAWPQAVEKDGGVDEIRWDNDPDHARRDGERMTIAYQETVAPRLQPVGIVEQKISLHVEGVPVPIIGYLDFEEEADVVDWKTGKQVQRKPDSNWRMQGAVYSLATKKPVHFHSISRAKVPSIATPLTDEEMAIPYREDIAALTSKVLVDYSKQVEFFMHTYGPDDTWPTSGLFMDYKGGSACKYCGFRKNCAAWAWERVEVPE